MEALIRHKHNWRVASHLDGCHEHTTVYACQCGETRSVSHDRNLEIDPYAAIWMLDQDCERCKDLLAGAQPLSRSR